MNRLFFRFFMLVMLAITLATFVIYFAISRLYGDPIDDIALRQAAGQILLLEQYVDKAPADEWLARLNKAREVSNVDFELIPLRTALAALPEHKHAALLRGEFAVDGAHKALYRRVDLKGDKYVGSIAEVVELQGVPIDIGVALKTEALRFAIVALCLLVPAALWSRAHWRGLQALSKAADDFGAGKLATRTVVKKSAAIYPLAERMNEMAQRIETLLGAHKTLLHSVSHELRTPIARLEFGLELLRDGGDGNGDGNGKRAARMRAMQLDLRELDALVNELLQLARLDQAIVRAPFALPALLEETAAALDHARGDKRVVIECDAALPDYDGDRRLVARAVSNLLRNAQKYARQTVVVSTRRIDGGIEIAVDDDGPGIALVERERVFDAFYRLDQSRGRDTGGFGLGLAIARQAILSHGGTIAATDSPFGGARFTIRLPA